MTTHPYQDHFFHRAKKENYLARAVYKLDEIQKKYRLIRPGNRVLDLGASPGSWVQLASGIVGPSGLVVGVDIKPVVAQFPSCVRMLQRDVFDVDLTEEILRDYAPFDVVLSDMAPSTSGIKSADAARSALLVERALELARLTLKPQGHFLAKIFQGSDFHSLLQQIKRLFGEVRNVKPEASRKQSKEIYMLAMRFKKPQGGE